MILSAITIPAGLGGIKAQGIKTSAVPAVVQSEFKRKYPGAGKISWKKEMGNYEANWGGKSGEANSVQFHQKAFLLR